jgi:DNA-binding CsgD family transcriptional regulator/PAS domain-containing protein
VAILHDPAATRSYDVIRTLYDTAGAVRDVIDPKELADTIAEQMRRLLNVDAVSVYVSHEDSGELVPVTPDDGSPHMRDGIVAEAFAQQRPVLLPTPDDRACTEAAVPLIVGQRAVGVLLVTDHNRPRAGTSDNLNLLALFAAILAPALDRARWHAESESQRQSALEHAERLTQILDQLPSGVIVLDNRGYVVTSNPAAQRACKFEIQDDRPWADQVAGFDAYDPLSRRPLRGEQTPADRALAGETVGAAEVLLRQPGRKMDLWLRIDAEPLRDARGRASGAVLVYTDVTRERTLARDLAATALEHAKLLGKLTERRERLEYLADQVVEPRVQHTSAPTTERMDSLTERDRDILRLLARGLTNKEIGAALHLTAGTVRNRVGRLLNRLGASDRTQAAVIAVTRGILNSE